MALDQIDQFLNAIGTIESGNNYGATGVETGTYGRALGRYQVMSKIAPSWMRELGYQGSDSQLAQRFHSSPAIQDRVARHKMTSYYRQFGSWELVAVAWFAGPGRAKQAQRAGISSLSGMSDVLGTSVPTYVQRAMSVMGQQPSSSSPGADIGPEWSTTRQQRRVETGEQDELTPSAQRQVQSVADQSAAPPEETQPEPQPEAKIEDPQSLAEIMAFISQEASKRGAAQVLDMDMLLGKKMGVTTDG